MADPQQNELPMPPAEWPKVTLGGVVYELRFGMLATYELSRAGVNPAEALTVLTDGTNPHNIAHILDIWRAATSHTFTLAKPKREIPSVEEWIAIVESEPDDPMVKVAEIARAVRTALFKWSLEQAARKNAANPVTQNAAATPAPVN